MTSVKEFRVGTPPTDAALGRGQFEFTDAYSVFDWGRMPDAVPGKGASLCTMGAFNFELLEAEGVETHYRGVVDPDTGRVRALGALDAAPTRMAIRLARVPELPFGGGDDPAAAYDYDAYHSAAGNNYLIPLEVVFRNAVPLGSSLRDRASPRAVGLDRADWPDRPVDLPEPVVEFSTKYEEQDRYLDRGEADRIAGDAAVDRLEALARAANDAVTRRAGAAGLAHEDGKIECLYHDGTVAVADVVGTFDENRFSRDGRRLSKEILRQYYRRADPAWVAAVSEAKAEAAERGVADWRALCDRDPEPLPEGVIEAVAGMYAAGTNAYTGREWFAAPPLDEAVEAVAGL